MQQIEFSNKIIDYKVYLIGKRYSTNDIFNNAIGKTYIATTKPFFISQMTDDTPRQRIDNFNDIQKFKSASTSGYIVNKTPMEQSNIYSNVIYSVHSKIYYPIEYNRPPNYKQ